MCLFYKLPIVTGAYLKLIKEEIIHMYCIFKANTVKVISKTATKSNLYLSLIVYHRLTIT